MPIQFLTTDTNEIYTAVITSLEDKCNEPLYPGDERRIFGEAEVALIAGVYNAANDACKQKMLQFARGEVLDGLGVLLSCERISPSPAVTTMRFGMNASLLNNVIIPAGTKVSPGGTVYFSTREEAVIEAGKTSVDVEAACMDAGAGFNGYALGTINQLVDLVPYIDTVMNVDISHDGDDGEPYTVEGDDLYRERIRLAPSALSVAGPENSYKYHVLSADSTIVDAAVICGERTEIMTLPVYNMHCFIGGPNLHTDTLAVYVHGSSTEAKLDTDYTVSYENYLLTIELTLTGILASEESIDIRITRDDAMTVTIVPICAGGVIPDEDMIRKVQEICSAKDVRPMTDKVIVKAPTQVSYDIDLTYYTTTEEESACIKAIEDSGGAIEQYVEWQGSMMGRNINPDKLRSLCLNPKDMNGNALTGCTRIEISEPTFRNLDKTEIASYSGNITVRHVLEDDV